MEGKESSKAKQVMQKTFTNFAISRSNVQKTPKTNPFSLATGMKSKNNGSGSGDRFSNRTEMINGVPFQSHLIGVQELLSDAGEVSGFGIFGGVPYVNANMDHLYYRYLLKTEDILKKAVKTAQGEQKTRYQYMLIKVKRAMEKV